jgi:predicted RND superfamily exporter protein
MLIRKLRFPIIAAFLILAAVSIWRVSEIRFVYEFERFFPQGDPDVEFFQEFRQHFEPDDNFVLIGIPNEPSIYDSAFLNRTHLLSLACDSLELVKDVSSVTLERRMIRAQFMVTSYPVLNHRQPEKYNRDSAWIAQDERYNGRLVSADGKNLVIIIKTLDSLSQPESVRLIEQIDSLAAAAGIEEYHLLGKAFFQKELVQLQQKEFIISTLISGLLVSVVFWLIFRRWASVILGLISVGISMSMFLGYLILTNTPLDLMSALYPVLMIIVGVSDVVHVLSKYTDELQKGHSKNEALKITIKEIGLATLMTSLTTAIGFATLLSSRIVPIKTFGITCAAGVMIAYVTVILFLTALLAGVDLKLVERPRQNLRFLKKWLLGMFYFSRDKSKTIIVGNLIMVAITGWGIFKISTDSKVYNTLPRDTRIEEDFRYFEQSLNGFRPFEIMVTAQDSHRVSDLTVMRQMDTIESYLKSIPEIGGITSVTTLYKSMNRAYWGGVPDYYRLPESEKELSKLESTFGNPKGKEVNILISNDGQYGRISGQIKDIGFDDIRKIQAGVDSFIANHTDPSIATFRQTGTGILVDKNNRYLRESLIVGLALAFLAVSILMSFLFRDWKMVLISLIPNILPLLVGGAIIGFLQMQFDAPTSIIFAISFGIAVDDTIHFLSKYRIELSKGRTMERALQRTFVETGQAIAITSVILFVGFLVLLFSKNPATFNAGILISSTLFSALFADLLIIPVLLRRA